MSKESFKQLRMLTRAIILTSAGIIAILCLIIYAYLLYSDLVTDSSIMYILMLVSFMTLSIGSFSIIEYRALKPEPCTFCGESISSGYCPRCGKKKFDPDRSFKVICVFIIAFLLILAVYTSFFTLNLMRKIEKNIPTDEMVISQVNNLLDDEDDYLNVFIKDKKLYIIEKAPNGTVHKLFGNYNYHESTRNAWRIITNNHLKLSMSLKLLLIIDGRLDLNAVTVIMSDVNQNNAIFMTLNGIITYDLKDDLKQNLFSDIAQCGKELN